MIRHARSSGEPLSFFGFLSVISCVIGLLMFVLVCITVVSFWGAEVVVEVPSVVSGLPGKGTIYVECTGEGLLVHPEKDVNTLEDLDDPALWVRGPYGRCLAQLRTNKRGGTVHFLIREDGLPVFRKALSYALVAGGGTADAVSHGSALFSIGQQLVTMPGPIRVVDPDTEPADDGASEPPVEDPNETADNESA
jgi:hypothetical protein